MNPVDKNNEWKKEAPVLSSLDPGSYREKERHKVPQGYFDDLAGKVLEKINEAPVLFSLEKKEMVEAPEGYFDAVEARVKQITAVKKQVPVVSIRSKIVRWAVAASLLSMVVTTAYVYANKENTGGAIAAVPAINTENATTNYLIDELHEEDLIAFVSEQETSPENNEVVDYLMEDGFELE
ncbi:MAG TPA: hypothetical protein VD905_15730 [Flavobacteriales bacterium]|nr:hypothetical protein [Flavobacteriales bacterium]